MYQSGLKKKFNKKGTRTHPDHPLHGTARILILASKHPKDIESGNEDKDVDVDDSSDDS